MKSGQTLKKGLVLFTACTLSGCAVVPRELDNSISNSETSFTRQVTSNNSEFSTKAALQYHDSEWKEALYLSRGDWLKLKIHSMPDYNGVYQIDSGGRLDLPFGSSLPIAGLSRTQAVTQLQRELEASGWFNSAKGMIDLSLVRFASITVSVSGAVFNAGNVTINGSPALKQQDAIIQEAGAHANDRNLISALVAGGGVRPDADLHNVTIKRGQTTYVIDLSHVVNGLSTVDTPTLIHGDEIHVRSKGQEATDLIRPTQITPPGMRILMSNLTAPALNNALSAVGADATRLPYGSSLLDAALSANCVGGTHQANASRSILLVTRHYGSSQQIVIRRRINQLLANSSKSTVNPFLMPNDGVACYDSRFTNIRDVARGLGEVFGPILLGRLL